MMRWLRPHASSSNSSLSTSVMAASLRSIKWPLYADPRLNPPVREREVEKVSEQAIEDGPRHQRQNGRAHPPLAPLRLQIEEDKERDGYGKPDEEDGEEEAQDPAEDREGPLQHQLRGQVRRELEVHRFPPASGIGAKQTQQHLRAGQAEDRDPDDEGEKGGLPWPGRGSEDRPRRQGHDAQAEEPGGANS